MSRTTDNQESTSAAVSHLTGCSAPGPAAGSVGHWIRILIQVTHRAPAERLSASGRASAVNYAPVGQVVPYPAGVPTPAGTRLEGFLAPGHGRPSTGMGSIPTDSEPTDEDLLGRLSSDPAAFEVFYRRHVDRVVGFAARRVSEPADIADLVAATFVTVLTAARGYDPERGEPGAWLLGITARLIANARRRKVRESAAMARIAGRRLIDQSDIDRLEERIAPLAPVRLSWPPRPAQAPRPRGSAARECRGPAPGRGERASPGYQPRRVPDAVVQRSPGAGQGGRRRGCGQR